MAGSKSAKASSVTNVRKRVDAQAAASLKRARDGSAFVRCEECNKDVAAALISMHSCSLEAKLKLNLEAQVVESQTEIKKKLRVSNPAPRKGRTEKKTKDENKPKRPPTAFFLFMKDFRKTYKEAHPDNKSVSVVAKECGEKWKSMSDEEKKTYVDKAAELKAEYQKGLEANNDAVNEDNEGSADEEEVTKEEKEDITSDDE